MKKLTWLLIGAAIVLLIGCSKKESPAEQPPANEVPTKEPSEKETPAPDTRDGAVTGLRFSYDRFSGDQVCLNAYVEQMTDSGAKVTLEKRVGPMNYTGHTKEGELTLSGAQVQALREILDSYDLEAWSHLRTRGSGASPSRSLIVFSGDSKLYDIPWDAVFPETLPPQEDIMYAQLFNFFNDLIAQAPGWEEVRSENLEDPRDNAAYGERTVTWFGHEVKLVPGTGTWHEDGSYAQIDYEGRDWWTEEGFVGRWTLDREAPTDDLNVPESASLRVREDGSAELKLNGETWTGAVSPVRYYRDAIGLRLEKDDESRNCQVYACYEESYMRVHVTCHPGPVPEPQFAPIDVYLLKLPE